MFVNRYHPDRKDGYKVEGRDFNQIRSKKVGITFPCIVNEAKLNSMR